MSEQFKHFSVGDFDRFDCVKISWVYYIVLGFLLRGYVVWLMSVTNFNDRVGVISWIYPEPKLFYLNLCSGAIGLFVLLLLSLRRPDAANWVQIAWPKARLFLIVAIVFDIMINAVGYGFWQLTSLMAFSAQTIIGLFLILLCFISQRMKLNLAEFPQPMPEK